MYRKPAAHQLKFENFYLPFGGFLKRLRRDNRWVILAKQIPWQKIDDEYSANFNGLGCPAKPARVALGSLIIKERLGTTDRETVLQIAENPYLQYFLGFAEYKDEVPFDHTLLTTFRKRFTQEMLADINEAIVRKATKAASNVPRKGTPGLSRGRQAEEARPPKDPPRDRQTVELSSQEPPTYRGHDCRRIAAMS